MATLHPYLGVSKEEGYNTRKSNEFSRTKTRRYGLHINRKTEKDIIAWLEENKPYQTAIKRLIKEQIAKEKKSKNASSVDK